jgi:prepilin-type N-terminal cleavage/methylation domain-containing protein
MVVRKTRRGYTLFEMLLVLAILVILAAVAYPFIANGLTGKDGLTGKRGQEAALDTFRSAVAKARERAMTEGRPYRVSIMPNKGNYRIAPDTDEFWGQGNGSSSANVPVVSGALPEGSVFCDPEAAGSAVSRNQETSVPTAQASPTSFQPLVTFLPDGTAQDNGQIALKTVGMLQAVTVKFQASTGVLTAKEG